MVKNMCGFDKGCRFVLGIVLIIIVFYVPAVADNTLVSIIVAVFGAINILSASASFCPMYHVAGISSLSKPSETDVSES